MIRYRHERKYLVSINLLARLRKRFEPFIVADTYSESQNQFPEYTVRSVYFDSPDTFSYFEKIEGLKDRKKFRVRGYGKLNKESIVVLEIKKKVEDRVAKNRAFVPYSEVREMLRNGNLSKFSNTLSELDIQNSSRFLFNLKRYHLRPQTLIVYDREAYHGKFDQGVRVTFDKNIRFKSSPSLMDLYSDFGLIRTWKGYFILEIKYFDSEMPSWSKSIIKEFQLKNEALSKYAQGVESGL